MNTFQEFIALSRYSRWMPELGRREAWDETVNRWWSFFTGKVPALAERCDIKSAILSLEVLPSMRGLMTAGPALDRDHTALYNPVCGDTLVVTKEYGNIPIKDLVGTEATVLNKDGNWASANFKSYGIQPLTTVTLRLNSNTIREVDATNNHRWLLEDGTVKPTEELKVGDKIPFVSAPKPVADADYRLGVMHGIVYGDGTTTKSQARVLGYFIRLCGDSRELLQYFQGYPVSYPPSYNGDPVISLYDGFGQTHQLKDLPPDTETDSYLLGFMRGWLAADGSVTKSSQVTLCLSGDGLQWVSKNSERLGFVVQHVGKLPAVTNYGKRKHDSYRVSFARSSLTKEDFLCSWKRANFKELASHYVVHSVAPKGSSGEVFCAHVPDTNTFVLSMGLVTGNCAYMEIDTPKSFGELMYILMCGTGVGYTVESRCINKLPVVPTAINKDWEVVLEVEDSREGWCNTLTDLVLYLYDGVHPKWDTSKVRGAGERLRTFGGRASGPAPLEDVFRFVTQVFYKARGRHLTPLECHDICCKIAQSVIVGGVRRSAMISLSDLSDREMANCKSGAWWEGSSHRSLANNSAIYQDRPSMGQFLEEWTDLFNSHSGERGICNRQAMGVLATRAGRRPADWGTNPCSEIILRPKQFCNLSTVVVRENDTKESLARKIEMATVIGTVQSMFTKFPYLSKEWKENCEEEHLLGVSMTGIFDNKLMSGHQGRAHLKHTLETLKEVAEYTNLKWSHKLGIAPSKSICCIKPEGTTSCLADASSGLHPRYSEYYLRRVRIDKKDPLYQLLMDQGMECEDCVVNPSSTAILTFKQKAPLDSVTQESLGAMEHLQLWLDYQEFYCHHKPSITVSYTDNEYMEIGNWVWKNFDKISGISFLPKVDHVYAQAPFEVIDARGYNLFKNTTIDFTALVNYESEDKTTSTHELACSAGGCELK